MFSHVFILLLVELIVDLLSKPMMQTLCSTLV